MTSLTPEQIKKLNAAVKAKSSGSVLTDEQIAKLNAAIAKKSTTSGKVSRISKAAAAGTGEAIAGVTRLLSLLPSASLKNINKIAQNESAKLDKQFEDINPTSSEEVIKYGSNLATALAIPGGGEKAALKASIKLAPKQMAFLDKITKKLSFPSRLAIGSVKATPSAVAFTSIEAPSNESLKNAAKTGLIAGSLGGTLGETISSIPAAFRKIVGARATPEQIKAYLDKIEKGTPAVGAEALNSSTLRRLQSGYLLGASSKMVSNFNKIIQSLTDKATNIGKSIGADNPSKDPEKELTELGVKNFNLAKNKKNAFYNKRDKLAANIEFPVTFNDTRGAAQDFLDKVNASNAEFKEVPDSEFIKKLETFANKDDSSSIYLDKNGDAKSNITAIQTKKKELHGLAKAEKDPFKKSAYQAIANGIDSDLKRSIEESGNQELIDAQKEADDYFKNNFALYRDSEVAPFLNDEKDFRNIFTTLVKTGKVQSPERIEDLIEATSKETGDKEGSRNIVLQNYFAPAIEKDATGKMIVNPIKMINLYRKLKGPTRDAMFNTSQRKALDKLDEQVGMVEKTVLKKELNPSTGYDIEPTQAELKKLGHLATMAGAGGLLGGAQGYYRGGGAEDVFFDALVGTVLPWSATRALSSKRFVSGLGKQDIRSAKTASNLLAKFLAGQNENQ